MRFHNNHRSDTPPQLISDWVCHHPENGLIEREEHGGCGIVLKLTSDRLRTRTRLLTGDELQFLNPSIHLLLLQQQKR